MLKGMRADTRLDLILLTGREASIAAYLIETGRASDRELVAKLLGRLRSGSLGEAVGRLQQRLGAAPTGYFGGSTKKLLADFQRSNQLRSDGIYSAALDARLAWDVMSAPAPASAPPAAEQPTPTPQPDLVIAPDALERPETPLEATPAEAPFEPTGETPPLGAAPAGAAERAAAPARSMPAAAPIQREPRPGLVPTAPTQSARGATGSRLVFTKEALERLAPHALPQYRDALLAGNEVLALYGISESPLRFCHFLGQIASQCGRLSVLEEDMAFTSAMRIRRTWPTRFPAVASAISYLGHPKALADRVYGDRFDNRPGDGWRYRGRGFVLITGRANYRVMGKRLGIPLEDQPDLALDPEHALTIACETWMSKQLAGEREMNRLADLNKLEALSYRMTGGYFDFDDRRNAFREAWAIWGEGDPPDPVLEANVLERGDRGGRVEELNGRLKFLGLFDGITDEPPQHVFTLSTYKALLRLQEGEGIALSGVAGADTWTALDDAIDRSMRGPMARGSFGAKSMWHPRANVGLDVTERRLAEVRGWSIALAFFALAFVALYTFALIEPGRLGISAYWTPLLFAGVVFVGGLAMWLAARLPPARQRRGSLMRSQSASGSFVVGEEEPVRQGLNLEGAGK
jgi:putative chitinase